MKRVSPLDSWGRQIERYWVLQGGWKPKPEGGKALERDRCVGVAKVWALIAVA